MPNNVLYRKDTSDLNKLLLKNKVVIMEDSYTAREVISNVLKTKLECEVFIANNQDDVIEIAETERPDLFILDNCIGNNIQEGFDALERIKNLDKAVFVAILSAFATEHNRLQAQNLDCDLFMEKTNIEENVFHIVQEMLKHQNQKIQEKLKLIDKLEKAYKDQSSSPEDKQAQNRKTYQECKLNPDWLKQHQGNYATFVDGEFKFSEKDKDKFFDQLNNLDEYKEKQIFVTEVGKKEIIIEEPTSLWFELI